MNTTVILDKTEVEAITGYERATKQLQVLHRRGFHRAYINRLGIVVLERTHYEAVTRGDTPAIKQKKTANLSFLRAAT